MKPETAAFASPEPARCTHFTAKGRRCRLNALDASTALCFRHIALQNNQSDSTDLSSAFGDKVSQFKTAVEVHDFVAELTALLVQGRISCRRASVLTFCSQLLLRTLPAIEHEADDEPLVTVNIEDIHAVHAPPSHPVFTEPAN